MFVRAAPMHIIHTPNGIVPEHQMTLEGREKIKSLHTHDAIIACRILTTTMLWNVRAVPHGISEARETV